MSFLDKRKASAASTIVPHPEIETPAAPAVVVPPEAKTEVRRRGTLTVSTRARTSEPGEHYVLAPNRVPNEPGREAVPRTFRCPKDLDERLEKAVHCPLNGAIVVLLSWALDELDRQNLELKSAYTSPTTE